MKRSTLLHLRIPFSLYLMPVYMFALSSSTEFHWLNVIISFIAIHIFLYPASNGYNSYYDKDKGSIGGLEHPPEVSRELLYVSLAFDALALLLGLFISYQFVLMLFAYGLVSKAYSHPAIRLKKYGIVSWLTAGIFQGGFTWLMAYHSFTLIHIGSILSNHNNILCMLASTFMILAFYPMTQIYQHDEDRSRGDITISILCGVKGTFILSSVFFILADLTFFFVYPPYLFGCFQIALLPPLSYFLFWFVRVFKNPSEANFKSTMWLNRIASISLIIFFAAIILTSTNSV